LGKTKGVPQVINLNEEISRMALPKKQAAVVAEIAKKYGSTIDLKKSPALLVEIVRNYASVLDPDPNGGRGGVSPSSIAVAGPPPPPPPPPPSPGEGDVRLADVMRAVLNLQRDISQINRSLAAKAGKSVK
jgi:hypothetical protein